MIKVTMVQFIQSAPDFQRQFSHFAETKQDALAFVPQGLAWFDVFSLDEVLQSKSLVIAVYPNQALLRHHVCRLKMLGLQDNHYAAITSDLPPHAERDVWQRIERLRLPLLMITAQKLQSVNTLSQLTRHPQLGPVVVEQGHRILPHLWGPVSENSYERLSGLFQVQWQGRPPLFVLSQPLSQQYQVMLQSAFNLRMPQQVELPLPMEQLRLEVKPCITQYQKLKTLQQLAQSPVDSHTSRATVVVCHSLKDIDILAKRLARLQPFSFHHKLEREEKEYRLLQLYHESNPVLLVESSLLSELPLHQFFWSQLQIVFWQLPWSGELLIQQALPSLNPRTDKLDAYVLYAKEDYLAQRKWLSYQFAAVSTSRTIYLDHLNRFRHFCLKTKACRRVQLANWLYGWKPERPACGNCDICASQGHSSLWRNLFSHFLL